MVGTANLAKRLSVRSADFENKKIRRMGDVSSYKVGGFMS